MKKEARATEAAIRKSTTVVADMNSVAVEYKITVLRCLSSGRSTCQLLCFEEGEKSTMREKVRTRLMMCFVACRCYVVWKRDCEGVSWGE